MSTSKDRPETSGQRPAAGPPPARTGARSPSGTPRAGRRESSRRRYEQQPLLQRLRTPLLAIAVVAVVAGVSLYVFNSAAAPAYACGSIDTVQPAASGELGQVQPDMGNAHIQTGDKVTYPVCPPASGKHVNRQGYGPLQPKVYGPDDNSSPTGWVHNLEHGGLVLLYSCDKGACDTASIGALQEFATGFPSSPVCGLKPGIVGPVVARFEQMPTRFAALVWDRALYLDTLDYQKIYAFYLAYGERLSDGKFIAPPEPQCAAPSPSASAAPSAAPSASAAPGASASPAASAEPSAPPAASPSPSAS